MCTTRDGDKSAQIKAERDTLRADNARLREERDKAEAELIHRTCLEAELHATIAQLRQERDEAHRLAVKHVGKNDELLLRIAKLRQDVARLEGRLGYPPPEQQAANDAFVREVDDAARAEGEGCTNTDQP